MNKYSGRMLVDRAGNEIGTVVDVILHPINLQPEWLVVRLGRIAGERLVPTSTVETRDDHLVAPFLQERVKAAPRVRNHMSPISSEREEIYRHYGLAAQTGSADSSGRAEPTQAV